MLHSHDTVKFGKRHGRLSLPLPLGILSVFCITFFGSVMSMKTRSIQYTAHSGPLNHVPWMAISLLELMPYPLQNVRAKLQNPRKSVPRHRAIYRRSKSTKWEKHHSIGKNIENNTQFKSTHALFCVIINTERVVNLTEPDEPCGWPVIHRANLPMKLKTSLTYKEPNSQTRMEA